MIKFKIYCKDCKTTIVTNSEAFLKPHINTFSTYICPFCGEKLDTDVMGKLKNISINESSVKSLIESGEDKNFIINLNTSDKETSEDIG